MLKQSWNSYSYLLLYRFWHESDFLCNIEEWFKKDSDVVLVNDFKLGHGKIKVKCGDLNCIFEIKAYCHGSKRNVIKPSVTTAV